MTSHNKLSTWMILLEFGFLPDGVTTGGSSRLSHDFGDFKLVAVDCINTNFQKVVLFTGLRATTRTLAEIVFEIPSEVDSVAQCAAWLVWQLNHASVGKPLVTREEVAWAELGQQNQDLLPWVANQAAYQKRPKVTLKHDWAKLMIKTLANYLIKSVDANLLVTISFDGRTLIFTVENQVISSMAEGESWTKSYTIAAESLRDLPKRLKGDRTVISIWESKLFIDNRGYPLFEKQGIDHTQ